MCCTFSRWPINSFFTLFIFITLEDQLKYIVRIATSDDHKYAHLITDEMADSAKKRGTGIARRTPEYVMRKMGEGKAVIAVNPEDGEWVGFCYIEAWQHEKYVANSGLIVSPKYRGLGVARKIKARTFDLSREKYPHSKIFGLTTGLAVMRINSDLGYRPVTYSELTDDDVFWEGCKSCVNYDILMSKGRKNCLCTAMLYDPAEKGKKEAEEKKESEEKEKPQERAETKQESDKNRHFKGNFKLFERWTRYKRYVMLKNRRKAESKKKDSTSRKKKFFFF